MIMILKALGIGLGTSLFLTALVGSMFWADKQDAIWPRIAVAVFWITVLVGGLAYMVMRQAAG